MFVVHDIVVSCAPHAGVEVQLPTAEHGLLQADPGNDVLERASEPLPAHETNRRTGLVERPGAQPETADDF